MVFQFLSVTKQQTSASPTTSRDFLIQQFFLRRKDVFDSIATMEKAKEIALKDEGPVIVHAMCVRMGSHSNSDKHELYRSPEEIAEAVAQDPIAKYEKHLLESGVITEKDIETINAEIKETVLEAHKAAMKAPVPSEDSIYDYLYAPAL